MATDKQKLARARNWFKYTLAGMNKLIDMSVLTQEEKDAWFVIMNTRNLLLSKFDDRSKSLGITILPKCWCGKVGKYKSSGVNIDRLLCKEHRDGLK